MTDRKKITSTWNNPCCCKWEQVLVKNLSLGQGERSWEVGEKRWKMGVLKGWEARAIRRKLCNQFIIYINFNILQSKNGLEEEAKQKGVGTGNDIAWEQALLFEQVKWASWERVSEGPRSCETHFTRPNRRACSQARNEMQGTGGGMFSPLYLYPQLQCYTV